MFIAVSLIVSCNVSCVLLLKTCSYIISKVNKNINCFPKEFFTCYDLWFHIQCAPYLLALLVPAAFDVFSCSQRSSPDILESMVSVITVHERNAEVPATEGMV